MTQAAGADPSGWSHESIETETLEKALQQLDAFVKPSDVGTDLSVGGACMLKLRGQLIKCSWGPLRSNAEAKAAWAALKALLDATPQLEAPVAAEELKAARQELNDRRLACERDLQQAMTVTWRLPDCYMTVTSRFTAGDVGGPPRTRNSHVTVHVTVT